MLKERESLSQAGKPSLDRRDLWTYVLLFAGVFVVFFLSSSRAVNLFDEGILLTATMRVMHGQVIHRDFYYNYGPAPLYLLAGFFKLFGSSVLVERIVTLVANCGLVVSLYALGRRLCGRLIAAAATIICIPWMIGVGLGQVLQVPLFALVMLWSTWLVLPIFQGEMRRRRVFAIGLLVGISTLCRYDYGAALIACHVMVIAIAVWWRKPDVCAAAKEAAATLVAYLLGAGVVLVPAAIAYLAVAPLHALLNDVVLYTAKYYRVGRGLPFPTVYTEHPDEFIAYVLPPALGLCAYLAALVMVDRRRAAAGERRAIPTWVGFVVAFVMIAALMYLKATVRIGASSLYLCTLPCVLVTAVLWAQRKMFARGYRVGLAVMLALLLAGGALSVVDQKVEQQRQRASTLKWFVSPGKALPPMTGWCGLRNAITKGFCYVVDDDHMRTIEFLETHTLPGDTLYVGLPRHDIIFANDNVTYFATQRMPATHWTQLDPYLENRADIQREMIADLERNRPPYIALDSTYVGSHEPNGSSVSTGVRLLDDYIAAHYELVRSFGVMAILQRKTTVQGLSSSIPSEDGEWVRTGRGSVAE